MGELQQSVQMGGVHFEEDTKIPYHSVKYHKIYVCARMYNKMAYFIKDFHLPGKPSPLNNLQTVFRMRTIQQATVEIFSGNVCSKYVHSLVDCSLRHCDHLLHRDHGYHQNCIPVLFRNVVSGAAIRYLSALSSSSISWIN